MGGTAISYSVQASQRANDAFSMSSKDHDEVVQLKTIVPRINSTLDRLESKLERLDNKIDTRGKE
jgi:hypothetical protein